MGCGRAEGLGIGSSVPHLVRFGSNRAAVLVQKAPARLKRIDIALFAALESVNIPARSAAGN